MQALYGRRRMAGYIAAVIRGRVPSPGLLKAARQAFHSQAVTVQIHALQSAVFGASDSWAALQLVVPSPASLPSLGIRAAVPGS